VTAAQLVSLGIQASMALMVFCIGLHVRFEDVADLLRHPGLAVRSLLAMNVIMPAVAVVIALAFDLDRPLKVALIALSVSPVPPILPGTQLKAGGRESYVVGLLVLASLVSIAFVPAAAAMIGRIFGEEVHTAPSAIARVVVTSVLAPLAAGIVVRRLAPLFASRMASPLSIIATVILGGAFLPVLLRIWPAIVGAIGNFSLVATVVFVVIGLGVGHLLGGPDSHDRAVLALATASRHPAVALAVVHDSTELLPVLGIVLIVLVAGAVLGKVYAKWIARSRPVAPEDRPQAAS
jgi:BASS family bile acid:Na+ symporter